MTIVGKGERFQDARRHTDNLADSLTRASATEHWKLNAEHSMVGP
jgi:hypothetical protein